MFSNVLPPAHKHLCFAPTHPPPRGYPRPPGVRSHPMGPAGTPRPGCVRPSRGRSQAGPAVSLRTEQASSLELLVTRSWRLAGGWLSSWCSDTAELPVIVERNLLSGVTRPPQGLCRVSSLGKLAKPNRHPLLWASGGLPVHPHLPPPQVLSSPLLKVHPSGHPTAFMRQLLSKTALASRF